MSEYPKFLPRLDADGKETDDGAVVVKNAEEEAAAVTRGHVVRERVQPANAPNAAGLVPPPALEYPRHLFRGSDAGLVSVVVKDADADAAARADGYLPLKTPADGEVHSLELDGGADADDTAGNANESPRRWRKKK